MSGLVEELRDGWKRMGEVGHRLVARDLFDRAADEITSLRASVLGLEGALHQIDSMDFGICGTIASQALRTLRDQKAALLPKEPDHAG